MSIRVAVAANDNDVNTQLMTDVMHSNQVESSARGHLAHARSTARRRSFSQTFCASICCFEARARARSEERSQRIDLVFTCASPARRCIARDCFPRKRSARDKILYDSDSPPPTHRLSANESSAWKSSYFARRRQSSARARNLARKKPTNGHSTTRVTSCAKHFQQFASVVILCSLES